VLPFTGHCLNDSFSVYFRTAITSLNTSQAQHIDSLLFAGKITTGKTINIIGYADEPGTSALNKAIANRRAASVREYLLASGVDNSKIRQCAGRGNLVRSGDDPNQRRVDIIMGDIGLDTIATAAPVVAAAPKRKRTLRDLGTMKPGELIVMENLIFKLSSNEFEKESLPILEELAAVLQDFPNLHVKFEGHVCCGTSSKEANKLELGYGLSVIRAQAVKQYLVKNGIKSSRLSYQGYGFSRPKIFPEVTQEDMFQNRRVEVRVISNNPE
jgi:outer membrane protein OmpA-like peptidoglycan-associated protein